MIDARSSLWDKALCKNRHGDDFFTDGAKATYKATAQAIRVCKTPCPILAECLEYALDHRLEGIWGGTTGRQRTTMRKLRGEKGRRRIKWT